MSGDDLPPVPKPPRIYTLRRVASMLGVPMRAIYGMVQAKTIPGDVAHKDGIRFDADTIDRWLRTREPLTMSTLNKFAVGSNVEDAIVILNLPMQARGEQWPAVGPLVSDEALNLAAWLVAITGRRAEFLQLLDAVEAT